MNETSTTLTQSAAAQNGRGMLAALRSFPRPVWVLCGGSFLNKFGTFVIPFLAIYMTRKGFSVTQAGLAISAFGLGNFTASIVGGHLADTIGRRKTIVLSMTSVALSMLLLSQAKTFPAILVLTALTGLTGEIYRPASSALLADLVPTGERVTVYAVYRLSFNAGWAFGPAAAGFLTAHSFTWLFIGDAATSLLFGLVAWFALPSSLPAGTRQVKWSIALKHIVRDWKLLQILAASFVIALGFFQFTSSFGLEVTGRGFSGSVYGALISLNGLLVVLFELPMTSFTRRFPSRRVIALGYLLIGVGFSLNAFSSTIPAFAFAMAIFTLGEIIAMPVSTAYIADLAPAHLRGRYMGSFAFAWSIALMIGPPAGMALFGVSPFALWMACGALGLISAAITLIKLRR